MVGGPGTGGNYRHIRVVPGTAEGGTAEKRKTADRLKNTATLQYRRKSTAEKTKYREPPKG